MTREGRAWSSESLQANPFTSKDSSRASKGKWSQHLLALDWDVLGHALGMKVHQSPGSSSLGLSSSEETERGMVHRGTQTAQKGLWG